MTDLDTLAKLAQAATPGPWEIDGTLIVVPGGDAVAMVNLAAAEHGRRDSAYIAAANPDAILALLDERDRAQRVIEAAKAMNQEYQRGKYDARTNSAFKDKEMGALARCGQLLFTAEAERDTLRSALARSMTALDDWLADFADTESDPKRVTEARNRIMEYGTIGYIAHVQQQNRAAMQEKKS